MNIGRLGTGVTDFMNGGPKSFSPSRQSVSSGPSFMGVTLASPDVHDPSEEKSRGAISSSTSLLAGNFFDLKQTRSRYAQASVERFGVEQTMGSKLNTLVNEFSSAMTTEATGRAARCPVMDFTYVTAYKYGIRAEKRVKTIVEDEYMQRAKEKLEKDREELEKKAEEALARSGEKGRQTDSAVQDTSAAQDRPTVRDANTVTVKNEVDRTENKTHVPAPQPEQPGEQAEAVASPSSDAAFGQVSVRREPHSAGEPSSATIVPTAQGTGQHAAVRAGVDRYV